MTETKIGPTGKFPEGKLFPEDRGELVMGVTSLNGLVVLNFGTPVTMLAFPAAQARSLAEYIIKHVEALEKAT